MDSREIQEMISCNPIYLFGREIFPGFVIHPAWAIVLEILVHTFFVTIKNKNLKNTRLAGLDNI